MSFLGTTVPQITWNADYSDTFANTTVFGYPVDDWNTYSSPRESLNRLQTLGGSDYSTGLGALPMQHFLEFTVRWIPQAQSIGGANGWHGLGGWRQFLEAARRKNSLRFIPDVNNPSEYFECYLDSPMEGGPTLEPDGTKKITIVLTRRDNPFDPEYFTV